MPLYYVRAQVEHLERLALQPAQRLEFDPRQRAGYQEALESSAALAAFAGPRCMGCAGILDGPEGAQVWALLSKDAGPYMIPITRKVRAVIALHPAARFTATVAREFDAGHRWAGVLGFTRECAADRDYELYSYVKGDHVGR